MVRLNSVSIACLLMFSFACVLPAAATVGWFNGDWVTGIPGYANWYQSAQEFARVYDDFRVPAGGWTIAGVYSYNQVTPGVTEATFEIRSAVSEGNPGTLLVSGRSPATATLVATLPDGTYRFRIQIDGLHVQLAPGTYWLSVTPVATELHSYLCKTLGKNAVGTPAGNNGNGYFYSPVVANAYSRLAASTGQAGTSADSSQGILISGPATSPVLVSTVANAASFYGGSIVPGEVVSIFGAGIGPQSPATLTLDANGKVATSLAGVQVKFSGVAAPLTYVSSGQINAVVPYEIAAAANSDVQVTFAGEVSNTIAIPVAPAAPALFTSDGSGSGTAAILNQDGTYNGPNHPAAKGSYIVMYVTGEGETAPLCVTGSVTAVSETGPLTPQPKLPVVITIGGQKASVTFYGEAPGMIAGVMQVNVQVPTDAPSGNLALSVSVGGHTSPDGTVVSVQ